MFNFRRSILDWLGVAPVGRVARRTRRYVPGVGPCEPRPMASGMVPAASVLAPTPPAVPPSDPGPDAPTDPTDPGDGDGTDPTDPSTGSPLIGTVSWG